MPGDRSNFPLAIEREAEDDRYENWSLQFIGSNSNYSRVIAYINLLFILSTLTTFFCFLLSFHVAFADYFSFHVQLVCMHQLLFPTNYYFIILFSSKCMQLMYLLLPSALPSSLWLFISMLTALHRQLASSTVASITFQFGSSPLQFCRCSCSSTLLPSQLLLPYRAVVGSLLPASHPQLCCPFLLLHTSISSPVATPPSSSTISSCCILQFVSS